MFPSSDSMQVGANVVAYVIALSAGYLSAGAEQKSKVRGGTGLSAHYSRGPP